MLLRSLFEPVPVATGSPKSQRSPAKRDAYIGARAHDCYSFARKRQLLNLCQQVINLRANPQNIGQTHPCLNPFFLPVLICLIPRRTFVLKDPFVPDFYNSYSGSQNLRRAKETVDKYPDSLAWSERVTPSAPFLRIMVLIATSTLLPLSQYQDQKGV